MAPITFPSGDASSRIKRYAPVTDGTTAFRPAAADILAGWFHFRTDLTPSSLEFWDGANWLTIAAAGAEPIQDSILDAKGDVIAATAADTAARLAVGSNNKILSANSAAATGLSWDTHHFLYCGLAATAQTGWGAGWTPVEWDSDLIIDTAGFTHSTTTDPDEITVDVDCYVRVSVNITFTSSGTGNGQFVIRKDTGSGFSGVTGARCLDSVDTAGARITAVLAGFVMSVDAGDKIQVIMGRYGTGTFDTIAEQSSLNIEVIRRR